MLFIFFRYVEEDKEIEKERGEAGISNKFVFVIVIIIIAD